MYIHCVCVCCYVYLMSQNWSKIQTSWKKPPVRIHHSACCMTGDHPVLMVVGGWNGALALSDVWLLDVTNGLWNEVLHDNVGCTCMCLDLYLAELLW